MGILLRVACIFVADGAETELRLRVALSGSCFAVTGQKPRICSKWSPWSAGCGSCGAKWCFVRWLQFGQNLEELTHGVSPGHADILVLEHEEIAIPRPGLFLPRSAQVHLGQQRFANFLRSTYIASVVQKNPAILNRLRDF